MMQEAITQPQQQHYLSRAWKPMKNFMFFSSIGM